MLANLTINFNLGIYFTIFNFLQVGLTLHNANSISGYESSTYISWELKKKNVSDKISWFWVLRSIFFATGRLMPNWNLLKIFRISVKLVPLKQQPEASLIVWIRYVAGNLEIKKNSFNWVFLTKDSHLTNKEWRKWILYIIGKLHLSAKTKKVLYFLSPL